MNKFEELPPNVRALLLAKLTIVLNTNRCASLYELAKRQKTDMATAWRGICQQSKQPVCALPQAAVQRH